MEKTVHIRCKNNNQTKCYPLGTSLQDVAKDMDIKLDNPILGAYVNNQLTELSYQVYQSKQVEFIDITKPDGMRMYIRSLSFVLYKACHELFPEATLHIEHSVSKGTYCSLQNTHAEMTIEDVFLIRERMQSIVNKNYPFLRCEAETEEVISLFEDKNQLDKTALLKHRGQLYSSYYKLNGHVGNYYGYLVPSTGYLQVFDLIKYYSYNFV